MARTRMPAPAARPGQAEDREQRIAALRIRLYETAGQIRSAEDWARYLRAAARLHGETWANVLLISSRIPAPTLVRGYEAWRAAGRQVNRDEKGIEIFSGMLRQEPGRHGAEEALEVLPVLIRQQRWILEKPSELGRDHRLNTVHGWR